MKKCSTDTIGHVNAASAFDNSAQMRDKVSNVNTVNIRAQRRDGSENLSPRCQATSSQLPRERPTSMMVSTSNATSRSHQRRWSVDYCKYQTTPVILVRKNKKEPEPPERSASLLRLKTSSHSSFKRYSCPPIGILTSTSSSSSSNSSCCSPTSVPTSVIIGPDPLGWRIQPKSRSNSAQLRAKRRSLQIPLPAVPALSSPTPEHSSRTKPAVRPKPFRRHHSESSAFLRSLGNPLPVVTVEQLHALNLRPIIPSDESDDVFDEPTQGQGRVAGSPCKIAPPVPEKTAMAKKIAQLIACSRQPRKPVTANGIAAMKPVSTHWHQNMGHNSICATKMAELHLDNICNRNR